MWILGPNVLDNKITHTIILPPIVCLRTIVYTGYRRERLDIQRYIYQRLLWESAYLHAPDKLMYQKF